MTNLVDFECNPLTAGSVLFLPACRIDYPHLKDPFIPRNNNIPQPERAWYGFTALWDAEQEDDLAALAEVIRLVKVDKGWDKALPCKPASFNNPWYRSTTENEDPNRQYRLGKIVATLKSHRTPVGTFGPDNSAMDPAKFTSGCWVRPFVRVYAYQNNSHGINIGLSGVRFERSDAPLSSGGFNVAAALQKIPAAPIDNSEEFDRGAAPEMARKLGI